MSRKYSSYILIALLLLATATIAVPVLVTPVKAQGGSAWLKIVTPAWKGTINCYLPDGTSVTAGTPVCPDTSYTGFADRFNVTGMEAFVEVYSIDPATGAIREKQGDTKEPNATGFVQISWSVDDNWGLLVLVKAKSYYGQRIGEGSPFKGIIIYALFIPPRNVDTTTLKKIANMTGVYKMTDRETILKGNFSWSIDGTFVQHSVGSPFPFANSGPFDYLNGTKVNLGNFSKTFDKPEKAWVARAAKIFEVFHVHSWYSVKDNLSFAQIKIYDLDHTDPTSEVSLIQAAVTGEDGQSRYTREIYPPEEGLTDGKFENNKLVPIPLQIFNLNNQTVFHGGFKSASNVASDAHTVGAPHLNATVRVWWETVIVNQTIYYGKYINGTLSYATSYSGTNKAAPLFVGPLSVLHNNTVTLDSTAFKSVTNFINATVFYAHFCTFDNDTAIKFPDATSYTKKTINMVLKDGESPEDMAGQQLINAKVSINLKTTNDVAYYMTKNILTTNTTGCTDDPHKYRGGLITDMARFPNATFWYALYNDTNNNGIPNYFEARRIVSFWDKFGKYVWLNVSLMYNPADAKNLNDIPEGPKLVDIKDPARIGDEDVLESDYFNGNWSMLVANVPYANTLTLKDDKEYTGLDVLVSWKGGWQNVYPGSEQLVGEVRIKNPYGIAFNETKRWVVPPAFPKSSDRSNWVWWDAPIVRLDNITIDGTRGRVNMTTYVYDIMFTVLDALGNPLPPSDTEVDLRLPNGNFVPRTPSIDESLDTGMIWSYKHFGEGNVTFFQLPGNKGPYGVRILYMGTQVYYNIDEINVLEKTEFITIRTTVFKVKVIFLDCEDKVLPSLWVKYTLPNGWTDWRQTSESGEVEFPYIASGTLTIGGAWWKGVEVPLMKAEDASGKKLSLTADGALVLSIGEDIDLPVKVWVPIKDIIFYTTDFQGEMKIPFLNVTVTWLGTPKPWSTEKIYYLETLDPTGDTNEDLFNTTKTVHPLWFSYKIEAFFQKIAEDSPTTGLVTYEAKYVFYKMPPAIYNITVTTVVGKEYVDKGMATPGVNMWPGRNVEVPYEIKIDWKGWSEKYEDTVPTIRTASADKVNDRVVLRIFGSMNGVPVTAKNFPAWLVDAWNPDLIGNRTAPVCSEVVVLKTWAHDFWTRVIDGDLRVGDAQFRIVNDNGRTMRYYDISKEMWTGEIITSSWTEDVKVASALDKVDLAYSPIFWNGSYNLTRLYFETNMTYSYTKKDNASFIVDKFYNASAPNTVAEVLNFTLVGTENLWRTDSRFAEWVKRITGKTWKNWFSGWFVVYELPKPTDEYKVEAGPDGKGVLPIPIPVAFVKLSAFAKDGKTPLANALIELWIAHLDVNKTNRVKISDKDEGTGTLIWNGTRKVTVSWKWEKKLVETSEPQVFENKTWDRIWLNFTLGTEKKIIFVQVPPSPAKLLLRNVVDEVDVAVSADYIYPMITASARDMNPVWKDPWGEEDGLLAYGRWYTDTDGYVDSFKDLGKADPRYGTVVLPISGWLNETFHDDKLNTTDEFHYQINVVWKSAVVYSDNVVLDKKGYAIGPTEVYNVRFMFTLCNSTDPANAVKNLNLWIYYPNVTEWQKAGLWNTVPPKPQDYKSCEESDFGCSLRVTLISSMDADGVVSFDLLPGPRFMNTTWKYVFSANHSAITWLDDLVHTKLVLNNETFGDDGLRAPGKLSIDVPIMLAAAKEINFVALTWRDEAGRLVPYPIQGYTVKYAVRKLDAGITAIEGSGVTDATGTVNIKSTPTDPTKVFWVGMTIRYRVEPPAYTSDYAADFWKAWLTGKDVELVDKKAEYVKPAVEPKMTHAYFPDESPYAYAIKEIDTTFSERPDGKYDCIGLCVVNARSKPFLVQVNYTAVTAQVQDFNGRPIEGVLVMLVDKATGKLAAWHYTAGKPWTAKPVDDAYLRKYHVAKLVDEDRSFGGAGYTGVMNVSIGPVAYDVDNDDKVDVDLSNRGYVGGTLVTYIVRTFYLPAQEKANDEVMKPVWPYLPGRAQEVYNSERDQVEWKVLLPRALPTGTLYIPAAIAPTGSLVKEHADVRAAVFDAKMRFGYEGKTLTPDIAKDLKIVVEAKEIGFRAEFSGRDTVSLLMLPRGTYTVEVTWKGETVARKTFDLSTANIGTVTMDVDLGLTDAIFAVKDLTGRAVPVAADKVSIENGPYASISVKDNKVNVVAMIKSKTYTVAVSYTAYGKTTAASYVGLPEGLKELVLPVGDVAITVVDVDGRPVGGATVKLEGVAETKTDSQGRAIFQMLPLEDEAGKPISYGVTVTREKTVTATITTSRSSTDFKILYGLGSIKVIVRGAAGQTLAGARVDLLSGGALVGTAVTDDKGEATFTGLAEGTYTVKVDWKTFKDEKTVTLTESDIMAKVPKTVEFALPPFTEIAGVPLDFGTFVALIVGIILLVIVIAVIISEYVRWRGRRLGIYPPPPPKK